MPVVLAIVVAAVGWLCWAIGKEQGRAEERCRPPIIQRQARHRTIAPTAQRPALFDQEDE